MRVLTIAHSEGIFDVARKMKTLDRSAGPTYDAILADVVGLVDAARHAAVRSTNAVMTATYWAIGRRIVEQEQHGAERAGYGEELIVRLSTDFNPDSGEGSGGQTCSRCVPFTLLIATFSGRRLENLIRASGKSRQCLDNLQTTTLWFPSPLASRYPGRTMLDYWRCVI
jgi:hypothetical protein